MIMSFQQYINNSEKCNYLEEILLKYEIKDLSNYSHELFILKKIITQWANNCFREILLSGSRAKCTAIHLASDIDYLVSLTNNCNQDNGGLTFIYNSLYEILSSKYPNNIRKQNVSIRINLNGLEVDITPARKHIGNTNDHSLYVSKFGTWQLTNIQKHINDISNSGRTKEIKLLKIWRELNSLDFPSIYLEYLVINKVLFNKSKDVYSLSDNFLHILNMLSNNDNNPLLLKIEDPANSNNILSDLLNENEKNKIKKIAALSIKEKYWQQIVW